MGRVRLCVCGSWFVGREGQAAHPRAPGQCLHFECRGAPAPRVRVWRCEGHPPCPTTLCVWRNLPYLMPPAPSGSRVCPKHSNARVVVNKKAGCPCASNHDSASGLSPPRSRAVDTRAGSAARRRTATQSTTVLLLLWRPMLSRAGATRHLLVVAMIAPRVVSSAGARL